MFQSRLFFDGPKLATYSYLVVALGMGACSTDVDSVPTANGFTVGYYSSELTLPGGPTQLGEVVPTVLCVDRGPGRSFVAHFGNENQVEEFSTEIPIGADNKFLFGDDDRGQPTLFTPGKDKVPFLVESDGRPLLWKIRSPNGKVHVAIATRFSRPCDFGANYCGNPADPLNPTDVCGETDRCILDIEPASLAIGTTFRTQCREFAEASSDVGEDCVFDILSGENSCDPMAALCVGFFSRTDEDNPFKLQALCAGFCDQSDPSTCDGECVLAGDQPICLLDSYFDF